MIVSIAGAIAVNGYDEAIRGWGLEDDEFVGTDYVPVGSSIT